ncbi:MAG: hypothetical protein KDE47_12690 [Caldilineaceae bacterium]|nr:hypothetical protein [Caldilineaceae bacterium]MCB0095385.1 hypothetical protein [Caldilineaceae bacterium]
MILEEDEMWALLAAIVQRAIKDAESPDPKLKDEAAEWLNFNFSGWRNECTGLVAGYSGQLARIRGNTTRRKERIHRNGNASV